MFARSFYSLLLIFLGLFAARAADSSQIEVPTIQLERGMAQLFIDDFILDDSQDVRRTLWQPRKEKTPVLESQDEFGDTPATLEANGTILFDPRLRKFVMFALGYSSGTAGPGRVRLYRFTSTDGLAWIKGDDGTPERIEFDLRDEASGRSASNIDLFSCCYDTNDAAYPYKGWLWFANWGDLEGLYFVRSRDGKNWERGRMVMAGANRKIVQDGRTLLGPGDVTTFYHDSKAHQFLASIRFSSRDPAGPDNHLRARAYLFAKQLDEPLDLNRIEHVALVPAAAETNGDLPHDEYYSSTAWRYESLWLGALRVWHAGGDYSYSAAGAAFLKLVVSRDGLGWHKVQFTNDAGLPEVFIPNGPEGGDNGHNDGGYMSEFSQGPLRFGDDLVYYYGASSYGKNERTGKRVSGGGIFRARLCGFR